MRLKKLTLATLLIMSSTAGLAASKPLLTGSNLGYGEASNNHTIFSSTTNPAWIGGNLHVENNFGMGLTGGFRFQQKGFGELNDQYVNNIKPILTGFNSSTQSAVVQATELEQELVTMITKVRDDFSFQLDAQGNLPMVFTHNELGGFGLELSFATSGTGAILSDDRPVTFDPTQLVATGSGNSFTDNDLVNALDVKTGIYLKTAVSSEVALTYGDQFYQNDKGQLAVGFRAKMIQASLVKSVNSFKKYLTQTANNQAITIADDLSNHSDLNQNETAFGLDIGAQWFAENWMAGLMVQNINSPKFNYNDLGVGSSNQAYTEQYFSNQYALSESVELTPQARIEGAYYSKNRHWTLAGSVDLNDASNFLNQQQQWMSVSASYATDAAGDEWYYALIPDFRISYHSNMAGDKRKFYAPGLSWGPLNLDMAFEEMSDLSKLGNLGSATDETIDLPKMVQFNLGLEFYF